LIKSIQYNLKTDCYYVLTDKGEIKHIRATDVKEGITDLARQVLGAINR
jgi:hypothetical protein